VFKCYAQLLLVEVRLLQYLVLEVLQSFMVHVSQVSSLVLIDGCNHMFFDVLEESLDEGCSYLCNSSLQPDIIVEEVSLASQDAQVDCEVVVLAVNYWDQTLLHFLGDIKHSREVHYARVMLIQLINTPDHQLLIVLPQLLQDRDRVYVVA
jgi:hypothetical protein